MTRVLKLLISLYPRWWRERYGRELAALVDDLPSSPRAVLDVAQHVVALRLRAARVRFTHGGRSMKSHQTRAALLAAAIVAPTALLIAVAVLKYIGGVAAPFDAIEPYLTPVVTHPAGETILTLAPYAAFLLAVVPVIQLQARWQESRMNVELAIVAPIANVAVAVLSLGLAVFMMIYWVAENL